VCHPLTLLGLSLIVVPTVTALERSAQQQSGPIAYLSYSSIVGRLQALAAEAPDIISVWNAQERFGLPSPGTCEGNSCKHWFATVTSPAANSSYDRELLGNPIAQRPQVFFSGNLHGDEKVGARAEA
jgi:hypothetical protein